MDDLNLRVVLLGIALAAAFGWLASALWRAPKRRSRWQRWRELRSAWDRSRKGDRHE